MTIGKTHQVIAVSTGVLVSILVMPQLIDPINTPKLFALLCGSLLSLILVISVNQFKFTDLTDKLSLVFSVLFVATLVMSFLVNNQKFQSASLGAWGRNSGLYSYVALILLFLVLSNSSNLYSAKLISSSLTIMGFVVGVYAWLQYFKIDLINKVFPWYNSDLTLSLTLGNSNFASVFLGFIFATSIGFCLDSRNLRILRLFSLISIFILMGLVPLLDTQGQVIFVLGAVLILGIWLTFNENLFLRKLRYFWWIGAVLIGVLGFLGLSGVGIFGDRLSAAFINLKDRIYHWQTAINMMKDHLMFGVGIDNFGQWQRRYRSLESIEFRGTPMSGADNAHNTFLQIGATTGLLSMLIYITIMVFIFWRSLIALKVNSEKILVGSLLTVWICYQVQSFISPDQIGLGVWNWIIGGSLVGLSKNRQQQENSTAVKQVKKIKLISTKKRFSILLISFIMIIPIINVSQTIFNENFVFRQLQLLPPRDSTTEVNNVSKSIIEKTVNLYDPKLRMTVVEGLGRAGYVESAFNIADKTTNDFPNYIGGWEVVALILEQNNQQDKAVNARAKTVELDPLNQIFKDKLIADQAK